MTTNSHIAGVYARLVVSDGAAAIGFYRAALGEVVEVDQVRAVGPEEVPP